MLFSKVLFYAILNLQYFTLLVFNMKAKFTKNNIINSILTYLCATLYHFLNKTA